MGIDFILTLIMTTILGGAPGNDLISFIPTDSYWKAKDVQVTPASMLLELNSIKSDDTSKATAVRKLMAIRTLGESKSADAMNTLTPLLESKEMFVHDYAQRAIELIGGKKTIPLSRLSPDLMGKDLLMLPEHIGSVAQVRFRPGGAIDLKKLFPQGADDASVADQKTKVDGFVSQMIALADLVGDIRIDGATIGFSDAVSNNSGFLVLIVRGQYDHKAVAEAIKAIAPQTKDAGDVEYYVAQDAAMCPMSDELFVMASAPTTADNPIEELLASVKDGKGKFDPAGELMSVIKTVGRDAPAWAAMTVTDSYKQAPPLAGLKSIKLTSKATEQGIVYTATATANDSDGAQSAADLFTKLIEESKSGINHDAENNPIAQPLADLVNSIEIKPSGSELTATATMKRVGQ